MLYKREDLLRIFRELYKVPDSTSSPIFRVRTNDYKYGLYWCPTCEQSVRIIAKVDGKWVCRICCPKILVGTGGAKIAATYRIINDLIDFFGEEVDSKKLFNPHLVDSFTRYAGIGIKENIGQFMIFTNFLRTLLAKEVGALAILGWMNNSERKLATIGDKEELTSDNEQADGSGEDLNSSEK